MGQACGPACCTNEEPSPSREQRRHHKRINSIAANENSLSPQPAKNNPLNLRKRLIALEPDDDQDGSPVRDGSHFSDKDGSSAQKTRIIQVTHLDTENDYLESEENGREEASSGRKLTMTDASLFPEVTTVDLEDVKVQEFDAGSFAEIQESSQVSRYQNDLKMLREFVDELQQEQLMVVAMRNVPNYLFEQVDWSQLDDMQQKLIQLCKTENYEDLNRMDAKAKKLNQRYRKAAHKEIRAALDHEVVRIAGFSSEATALESPTFGTSDSTLAFDQEEVKTVDAELTKKSVSKIVADFEESLSKALEQLGAYSNVEKHMNELVHRANFRFSDLHTWLADSRKELSKCHELRTLIQEELDRLLVSPDTPDEEKVELAEAQGRLKKQQKKAKSCEQTLQNQIGFSKQTYSTSPQTLLKKKSIEGATVLVKKVKNNMLDIRKMRAELEKILADIGSEAFGELKLKEWDQFEADMHDHMYQVKDEITTLISSVTAYMKEDKSESQHEVLRVASDAKKLRQSVEDAVKQLVQYRKTQLSLDGIIQAHYEMTSIDIQVEDKFRHLRQTCLKALSQFSDDYSLQKVSDLCQKLAQFSFVHFPEKLLADFQRDSYKGELTSAQLQKHTQLEALAAASLSTIKSNKSNVLSQVTLSPSAQNFDSPTPQSKAANSIDHSQTLNQSAPAFNLLFPQVNSPKNSQASLSAIGSSFFEDQKFDASAASSHSGGGSSFDSRITQHVSVGLCGLAGRPKLSMNESEAWIMDPRTPVKKFAALLFKLANVRQQVFKQLNKEFQEVKPIGQSLSGSAISTLSPGSNSFVSQTTLNSLKKSITGSDSFLSASTNETWYNDFVKPLMDRLLHDEKVTMVKLGPLNICKSVRCGYTYFFLGERARENDQTTKLLMPRFVAKFLLSSNSSSSLKEMLSALRRESLLIIVNYQFGFKRLDKIN